MASYDSDSSDQGIDVQTNVTLGYATTESTGDDISHVGGHPTWLDKASRPSAALAKCKVCNGYMSLLLQLQADLQQQFPNDERRLHVWCCRQKKCSKKAGSIRVIREVKKLRTTRQTQPLQTVDSESPARQGLGTALFGRPSPAQTNANRNPFSTSTTDQTNSSANPFSELAAKPPQPPTASFAEKLKISSASQPQSQTANGATSSSEPWPSKTSFPDPFPSLFLDAEPEYLDPAPAVAPSSSSNARITDLDDEPAGTSSNAAEKDLYESPHDKTFDHFTRVLSQNPEQVLRYEFRGQPLLYSSTDAVATHFVLPGHHLHQQNAKVKTAGPVKGIPKCDQCGAARVFEMQLTPYLIYELEKDNEEAMKLGGGEGMEWGTILVGTCSKNCGDEESGAIVFREEWVGVQWEEGGVELKQKR